jgi:putative transposase
MKEHQQKWAIRTMARVLKVSHSGYYTWVKNGSHGSKTAILDTLVRSEFQEAKGLYGYRRVYNSMLIKKYTHSENTVQRSMQRQGLKAKHKKRFAKTTDSNHSLPIYKNLLERVFFAYRPNQKWVGDITYIWTTRGWVYLAQYVDLCTHKVVGWAMSKNIDSDLACRALKEALLREGFPLGVLVHTDRGSTYCSKDYRKLISEYGCVGSMSRKGNCWDNAVAESFFGILKRELEGINDYFDYQEAYESIFEFIECWYNLKRLHSTIGYKSPVNYEKEILGK